MRALVVALTVVVPLVASSCKKKEPPPKKPKREDVMRDAASERRSVLAFVEGLKQVVDVQKPGHGARVDLSAISERLESVPRGGLPEDLGRAWQRVLKVFRRAAAGEKSPAIQADGQAASDELNQALRANGIIDFRF